MKDINEMTQKEFREIPEIKWEEHIPKFTSLIVLPERYIHDSGFSCMSFILETKDGLHRLSGGSDVIHLDGISGMGKFQMETKDWLQTRIAGWSIDCLKKSKLLRFFADRGGLSCSHPLSSFEIYSRPIKD